VKYAVPLFDIVEGQVCTRRSRAAPVPLTVSPVRVRLYRLCKVTTGGHGARFPLSAENTRRRVIVVRHPRNRRALQCSAACLPSHRFHPPYSFASSPLIGRPDYRRSGLSNALPPPGGGRRRSARPKMFLNEATVVGLTAGCW